MRQIFNTALFLVVNTVFAQQLVQDFDLVKALDETSGLEILDNTLITINDSGDKPMVYYLNLTGQIIAKHLLEGVQNNDWESLARDDEFLYVADIGNNYDTRTNLNILKLPVSIESNYRPEKIAFNYPEQIDFKYKKRSQFDGEALICYEDNLLIFTKDRATKTTTIYRLPKIPGTYQAEKLGTIDTQSIITGADYDPGTQLLVLTSTIDFNLYYILVIKDFNLKNLSELQISRFEIPIGKTQVEAIKIINSTTFWITSEDEKSSSSARLMKLKL